MTDAIADVKKESANTKCGLVNTFAIRFMFGSRVGFSGTTDRMAITKFQMAISPQRLIRSTYIARIARSSLRLHSFLV